MAVNYVLKVKRNESGYTVQCGAGTSVNEVICCCAIVGRVLVKHKDVESIDDFIRRVVEYATLPQYDEQSEEANGQDTNTNPKSELN